MTARMMLVALVLFSSCGICHGQEDRWSNFAEDADLKYYLDRQSITALPDNVYTFWVKSVAKDKDYFKSAYQLNNLFQILTNYELDCAVSGYRVRGVIMLDKNRRELAKELASAGESPFEPVQPESIMELVQGDLCVGDEEGGTPEATEEGNGAGNTPSTEPPAELSPGELAPAPAADAAAPPATAPAEAQ